MQTSNETGSGQSIYLSQMGHFFSGSRGSPDQIKENQYIASLKVATEDSEQLSTSDSHRSEHNSVLLILETSLKVYICR